MEMSMNKINFLSYVEERTVLVVKVAQSCPTLRPHGLYSPWNSPSQNTGVGSLSLLRGIFPSQGSNPGLPRCRRILSHKGSPKIQKWVAYLFSRGSSQPRNLTRSPELQADSLTTELSGKPTSSVSIHLLMNI